jgi:dGTPase
MDWNKLLNNDRRKAKHKRTTKTTVKDDLNISQETREEIERDFDRVLFLAPTRRLSDKTQVFPLELNDSVRTRLTHSYEVANIARGIGTRLAYDYPQIFQGYTGKSSLQRTVPSLLATIGLAHDLGNPPFGHQGESAIQSWFKDNSEAILAHDSGTPKNLNLLLDFTNFDGNSQTIRLLTRLQIINDQFGIDLTFASLAALLKYPQSANYVKNNEQTSSLPTWKKHGYFESEGYLIKEIWEETGLKEGVRHPLTYIMEACDDIAYSVLDAEDIVKKGLASYPDLMNHLRRDKNNDFIIKKLISDLTEKNSHYNELELSPSELNDICMQMFRVYSIKSLVNAITDAFTSQYEKITDFNTPLKDLISLSEGKLLCQALKEFDKKWGYKNKEVLKLELEGYNYITELMDMLWVGIHGHIDKKYNSDTPFGRYVYQKISENYRRVFEDKDNPMPMLYREAQLLTDAISGMTDSYLISLHNELRILYRKKSEFKKS